jgi:hypothetical protein
VSVATIVMTVAATAAVAQEPASAQTAPPTTADVPALKGMFPVYIVEKSGDEVAGQLISLTRTALVLQTGKPTPATRTFDLNDVAQVYRKGDSLKNGAIIGAIFGAATGIVAGLECTGNDTPSSCGAGTKTTIILTSIGAWSAIGVAIDALIPGRTLIWKSGR